MQSDKWIHYFVYSYVCMCVCVEKSVRARACVGLCVECARANWISQVFLAQVITQSK